MRRVLLGGAVSAVALLAATASAGAGLAPQMVATPNPITVGSSFTVRNVAGDANTCEGGGEVDIAIYEVDGVDPISSETVVPDGDGNWSTTGTASVVGDYVIEADCVGEQLPDNAPQATPDFAYASVPFQVVPVPATTTTSTTSSEVPVESTTTTEPQPQPAAAAVATPTFTG